jgi:hypothetical protein
MAASKTSYWSAVRAPRYSLLYALPLLAAYEGLAWAMGQTGYSGVRNGADVLLKSLFLSLGGRHGLTLFTAAVLGTGVVLVIRDVRRNGLPRARFFGGMLTESVVYALALGTVASVLTTLLLTGRLVILLAQGAGGSEMSHLAFPVQLMVSLGAGIYEELLFRVVLVSALAALARTAFGWKSVPSGIFAAVVGALIFSGFHYVGPLGDPFQIGSFTFRAIAGLLFSGLYLLRGFGITAWSHALYDVFLTAGGW